MLKIGLIVGSSYPNRFADVVPFRWIESGASCRDDFVLETLDLRGNPLPFLDESRRTANSGGVYILHPETEAWRREVGQLDGFIATVAEYNHGAAAVLKNALDSASLEWKRKPIAFLRYGGVGGLRAIEQLHASAIELQMTPLGHEVNIAMEPFVAALQEGKSLDDYPYLVRARDVLFDEIVWWANALKTARDAMRRQPRLAAADIVS